MATQATKNTAAATGSTAAAATVLIWALGAAGVDMPPEVAAAAGICLGGLLAWLTRPRVSGGKGRHSA